MNASPAKSTAAEIADTLLALSMAAKSVKSCRAFEVEAEAAILRRSIDAANALLIKRGARGFDRRADLLTEASIAMDRAHRRQRRLTLPESATMDRRS